MRVVSGPVPCYRLPMTEHKTQMTALLEALTAAGFEPDPDFEQGIVRLTRLPEFRERPIFDLIITMDTPKALEWESLFDGCLLESGRMARGAPHKARIYSRKAAVERKQQEKWAAVWSLYDAGILPPEPRPSCERWQDVTLP